MAIKRGNRYVVTRRLDTKANVNACYLIHGSALARAARDGNAAVISLLSGRGASITVGEDILGAGDAAHAAAIGACPATLRLMLDAVPDANSSGAPYGGVFQSAVHSGSLESVRMYLYLDAGADINYSGLYTTALQTGLTWLFDDGQGNNAQGETIRPLLFPQRRETGG